MAKFKLGSICLDELFAASKAGHSSITKAKNGKTYASIIQWENETTDQFGNDVSIQLNGTKENKKTEPTIYIGNLRASVNRPKQSNSNDDIPF